MTHTHHLNVLSTREYQAIVWDGENIKSNMPFKVANRRSASFGDIEIVYGQIRSNMSRRF